MAGGRKTYTDDDRAACLAALTANGGNLAKTARQVGVPRKTLEEWAKATRVAEGGERSATPPPPQKAIGERLVPKVTEAKVDLADAFERMASRLLEGVTDGKIASASAPQLLTAAGIAVDKMRLLRGQSTANLNHRPDLSKLTDEQLNHLERLAALARGD